MNTELIHWREYPTIMLSRQDHSYLRSNPYVFISPNIGDEIPWFIYNPVKATPLWYIDYPAKTKAKFYEAFKNNAYLKKCIMGGETYYVAKGAIMDKKFIPLLLVTTTYHINNKPFKNYGFENRSVNVWVSRKMLNINFRDSNKKLYKEINEAILPYLNTWKVPIRYKEDMDIWKKIHITGKENPTQIENYLKTNVKEFTESIFMEVFPSVYPKISPESA